MRKRRLGKFPFRSGGVFEGFAQSAALAVDPIGEPLEYANPHEHPGDGCDGGVRDVGIPRPQDAKHKEGAR